jgi:hypothetical protein
MELTLEQRKEFMEALMHAFRSKNDLEMMLRLSELDWWLNKIADGENYEQIVFKLIEYAEAQGQIIELFQAAINKNPRNPKLKAIEKYFVNPIEPLYKALLSLNYHNEVDIFKQFWNMKPCPKVGSFLVLGEPQCGQRWLVNRLFNDCFPDTTTTTVKKIPIHLTYKEKYIEDLWSRLSREVNSSVKPEKIVKRIYDYWKNDTVIIAIHGLDLICSEEHMEVFKKLWNPLVELVVGHEQSCESYLVMFLIFNNAVDSQNFPCTKDLTQWQFSKSLLMKIEKFTCALLQEWVLKNANLHDDFSQDSDDVKELANFFLKESLNGVPQLVMYEICKHCNLNWQDIENKFTL